MSQRNGPDAGYPSDEWFNRHMDQIIQRRLDETKVTIPIVHPAQRLLPIKFTVKGVGSVQAFRETLLFLFTEIAGYRRAQEEWENEGGR